MYNINAITRTTIYRNYLTHKKLVRLLSKVHTLYEIQLIHTVKK